MLIRQLFGSNNFLNLINKITSSTLTINRGIFMLLLTGISLTSLPKSYLVVAALITAFLSKIFGLFPQRESVKNWVR